MNALKIALAVAALAGVIAYESALAKSQDEAFEQLCEDTGHVNQQTCDGCGYYLDRSDMKAGDFGETLCADCLNR